MPDIQIKRVVVWFSAGVTSAWAAKMALDKYKDIYPVHLVNTDTGSEHPDNYRFMYEVSEWLGLPLEIIRSQKYGNTFEVYDDMGYMKNQHGATCTLRLKKLVRRAYEDLTGDLQVFGYDAGEQLRADRFVENNPEVTPWFPLIEAGITKRQTREWLMQLGINEPITYAMGFSNANCLDAGCIKGAIGYWNHVRVALPDVFDRMAKKERELNFAICATEKRIDGKRVKTPVFLDELDPTAGNYKTEQPIVCGLFCGDSFDNEDGDDEQ